MLLTPDTTVVDFSLLQVCHHLLRTQATMSSTMVLTMSLLLYSGGTQSLMEESQWTTIPSVGPTLWQPPHRSMKPHSLYHTTQDRLQRLLPLAAMELPCSTTLKVEVDYTLLHSSIGYICTRPSYSCVSTYLVSQVYRYYCYWSPKLVHASRLQNMQYILDSFMMGIYVP